MKIRKTFPTKGYTMIELMVTLAIFAIVTLFAVPAFFTFIEKSRAKTQIGQAASFLRSAQEIAIASNRTVYVFTTGLSTYQTDTAAERSDYWYQNWVMAFKPMGGMKFVTMPQQINEMITNSANYTIAQQRIFTKSQRYVLSIIDSANHNNVLMQNIAGSNAEASGEMEGYSKVRNVGVAYQGLVEGAPTFIAFYPSGEVSLPIFIVSERTEAKDTQTLTDKSPFVYDYTFDTAPNSNTMFNQWTDAVQNNFQQPIAILGGCRTGRSLTIDAINYTFNPEVMSSPYIFDGVATNINKDFNTSLNPNISYGPAPSFGHYLCGSNFLR